MAHRRARLTPFGRLLIVQRRVPTEEGLSALMAILSHQQNAQWTPIVGGEGEPLGPGDSSAEEVARWRSGSS